MLRFLCKLFFVVLLFFTISMNCAKDEEVNDHDGNEHFGALLFTRDVPRILYYIGKLAKYNYPILPSQTATACPEETEKEQVFNHEQSFGKHSLFVRDIYKPFENPIKINHQICHAPIKISVVYHTIRVEFQFGFEIYHDIPEFGSKTFIDSKRWHYDSITNIYTIKNRLKSLVYYVPRAATLGSFVPTPVKAAVSLLSRQKIYLEDKIEMGFVWTMIFFMKFNFRANRLAQAVYDPFRPSREVRQCDDWNLGLEYYNKFGIPIADLYSKENQKKILKGIKLPERNPDDQNEEDATCESEGQCFTEWLSVPTGQLQFSNVGPVSCSYLLTVPVWKSTIDDVLKKLDNFTDTILKVIGPPDGVMRIHSGVYGDLQLPTNEQNENVLKKITLAENDVSVPEIIYKLIKYKPTACEGVLNENDLASIPDELKKYLQPGYNEEVKPKVEDKKNDESEEHPKTENKDESNQLEEDVKHEMDDGNNELKGQLEKHETKNHSSDESTKYDKSDDDEYVLPDSKSKEPETPKNCTTVVTAMVVVIHNNPYFNPHVDKICDDMCSDWGWEEIQYRRLNGRRFKSKYIYCCKASDIKVRKKLGLNDKESEASTTFALNTILLPQINKKEFVGKDVQPFIVDDYQKSFEGGQPEPVDPIENNEAVVPIVKYVVRKLEFLQMRRPKHDGDEPVKSETEFVDATEDLLSP